MPARRLLVTTCLLLAALRLALAEPWVAAGDPWLRADLQRLSDSGVITSPVTSWPLSTGDIARDINEFNRESDLGDAELAAYLRVRRYVNQEMVTRQWRARARVGGAEKPTQVRGFEDLPRGDAEAIFTTDYTGDRFAIRLQAGYVADPLDTRDARLDGSHATAIFGNWMVSTSVMDRWWGPGWGGSLILSNNARPIPAVVLQRNYSTPFYSKWLSWIGPWSTSVVWGQLEDDRAIPDTRFFGWRVNFRPLSGLEIGLSRAAQWCGEDRPCDFDAFVDMLAGDTNLDEGDEVDISNQLGGFDARWASSIGSLPYAIYGQLIGEDEAGGLPSQYLGMFGVESWGRLRTLGTDWHGYVEYADTTCGFHKSNPAFDCAYNNVIYTTGYRFRGRVIGYSTDNDARTATAGVVARHDSQGLWHFNVRYSRLNRRGSSDEANTVSSEPADLLDIGISHQRETGFGSLKAGLGYRRLESSVSDDGDPYGFVRISSEF